MKLDIPYRIGQSIVYNNKPYIIVDVFPSFIAVTSRTGWGRKLIYKCSYNDISMGQLNS